MQKKYYNNIAGQDIGRIIAISDGVFAVALTLLVLEIRVPLLDIIHSEKELVVQFALLKSKFLVYLLAFMTTGIFWLGHSSQYKHIEKYAIVFSCFIIPIRYLNGGRYTKYFRA